MIAYVFSVYDRASQAFGRPFFAQHAGQATRSFTDEVNRPPQDGQNDLFSHPEDFELFELGSYDDSKGLLMPHDEPKLLLTGKQVKPSVPTLAKA